MSNQPPIERSPDTATQDDPSADAYGRPVRVVPDGVVADDIHKLSTGIALPAGAATAEKQDTGNTSLSSIDGKTPALVGGRVPVDGSGVTQPISAAALPLPAGASTAANQATANASLSSIDGKTPALGQALAGASVPSVLPAAQETSLRDVSDRAARLLGHTTVDSSALPTGAATAANQATEISSLSSIDGKTPALVSGRVPVDGSGVTQPVSGTITANQGTAAAASGAWQTKTTDGTNVQAVKAASTAAVATDPSAVVALSPNSPIPTGTNTIGAVTTPTTTPTSLADVSVTTAAALSSLTAGPSGILVTAHPNNSGIIRVSGSDVSATQGTPLRAGASFLFSVTNANVLHAIAESGTQTLCVTAV